MNRPTFRDFRNRLTAYAQSVGSPLGVCLNNTTALAGLVNAATERLIFDPMCPEEGWWGGWLKTIFNVSRADPYITGTREMARIILLDVCQRPVKLQNEWYEFLDYGVGLQPKACGVGTCQGQQLQAYDRSYVVTLAKLATTPQIIRIYPTDNRDVGNTVTVQGTDTNGVTIISTDTTTNSTILGEIVTLAVPFVDTVNQFATITGIEKEVTFGPVTIHQVNPTTFAEDPLSSMEPSETSAAYRRYLLNGLPNFCCNNPVGSVQVTAMVKLEFVPISSDSDYLLIPCIPALIAECECLRMENMDNEKAQKIGQLKHAKALQLLMGELTHYMGNERPAITVPIFGSDRLIRQPI